MCKQNGLESESKGNNSEPWSDEYLKKSGAYILDGLNQKRPEQYWCEKHVKSFFDEEYEKYVAKKNIILKGPLAAFREQPDILLPEYQKLRIVCLFGVVENNKVREHDVPIIFLGSAKSVGLTPLLISSSQIYRKDTRNDVFGIEQAKKRLDEVRKEIIDFRPDIILLAINAPLSKIDQGTIHREYISSIKDECGAKILGWSGDTISPDRWDKLDYWASVCDCLLLSQSAYPQFGYWKEKSMQIPIWPSPLCDQLTETEDKKYDVFFSGSTNSSKGLRFAWKPIVEEIITAHNFKNIINYNYEFIEYKDYLRAMAQSKSVIEFSSRHHGYHQINGRVWESIGCKSLVLTEDNEEIRQFFIPFVHYVPFRNRDELEHYLEFFVINEDYRNRIVQEAYSWNTKYFKREKVWNRILGRLYQ